MTSDRRRGRALDKLLSSPEFSVVVFSFLLNLAWEFWQVPFFRGMAEVPHWLGVKACTQATFGDSVISLIAFWATALVARNRDWILQPRKSHIALFIIAGLTASVVMEGLSVGILGRWAYDHTMPRLPVFGIGLLPIMQWLVIPPVILWFARRHSGTRSSTRDRDDRKDE